MIKSTIVFILLFNLSKIVKAGQTQQKHLAQKLEYPLVFNKESEVSVIVTSCGDMKKLQITIKSFLYFNTYPISKMYIVHCSNQQPNMESVLPQGYITNKQKFEIISLKSGNSLIDALEQVYKRIETRYVYQTDSLWQMKKGFGFIQQAINVLKYGQSQSMKMSQIVTNYPYWRSKYRLSQLMWTSSIDSIQTLIIKLFLCVSFCFQHKSDILTNFWQKNQINMHKQSKINMTLTDVAFENQDDQYLKVAISKFTQMMALVNQITIVFFNEH